MDKTIKMETNNKGNVLPKKEKRRYVSNFLKTLNQTKNKEPPHTKSLFLLKKKI